MKSLAILSAIAATASAASVAAGSAKRVSYDGTKVFRVSVGDEVDRINSVVDKLQLSTWKGAPRAGALADIVVPPTEVAAFEAEIAGMNVTTMHEDLGAAIADESSFSLYAVGSADATWFNSYHAYADHLKFLNDLVASYPNNAAIVTSGKSLQGNTITGIHIHGTASKGVRPAVVFHSTVHAREWISTMANEYIAWNLLSKYSTDAEIRGFVDKYDFYIFPVVNPDGFIYTQTTNRLWRKNRQTTPGSTCIGHDINRNWPFQWSLTGGASTNPCDEDFKGVTQGDAPETAALSAWLARTKAAQGLKLFIDFHAYSQLFMTPYGYSCSAVSAKNTELQSLARGAVAAIKAVHGTSYRYGPICSTIYKATGSSVDYVNDVVKADYTFTQELRDTGNYGFVLPAAQILPTSEETYAGIRYLLQNMK
ncbi:Zinc carboxypeptidase [Colletotrichum higginsianum IMI 349063]|uniref:Zinc carboxypeptidase n=1 Tax=Colletotrichum higginsianum (strain IMI 349063) TaxID=759273 RepID=A0A1B7YCX9_COLHI|nr:Zinc carboxypeptidase [Colletotrichum higginsianum IMI 349063]OBR09926.1 Zinc carboxypeptidase [Colletotrichum higginsianum IMI 349063]GJD03047.1 zinc carboxypeptidase [Colletotrichum higginsianum]